MATPWVAFPSKSLRERIAPDEWSLCLDSWIALAHGYLLFPANTFNIKATKNPSLVLFLVSYVKNSSEPTDAKSKSLRRESFLLIHRFLKEVKPVPTPLLEWEFMADMSLVYPRIRALDQLFEDIWSSQALNESTSMQKSKDLLMKMLETSRFPPDLERVLTQTMALLRACYPYGQFLMLGSDLIDAFSTAYEKAGSVNLKKKVKILTYFSLMSLMEPEKPKISILLDHLYSLNAASHDDSLLKSLIESTPLLQTMRTRITGQEAARANSLIEALKGFEKTPNGRPNRPIKRKIDKGKSRDREEYGHGVSDPTLHVHKLSLITQIQDLFPELGSGFITKLLDAYNDDPAQVTDHLLNDTLPPHLNQADHSEPLSHTPKSQSPAADLAPHPTPPLLPTRRNIYDDDAFDRLAISASSLNLGRKNADLTADSLLASPRPSSQKAAILSALAAFDSDDDERDDTYDVEDVGGTVDATNDDNADDLKQEVHEEALFNAYNMTPEVFSRDADTRRGKARAALKVETGMTDEAIEGWGIMVGRDPRRLKRLEAKFEMSGGGQQRALQGTAWKGDSETEGTEDSDAGRGRGGRGGGARGRGRGRGRGSAGGVAGPSDDRGTQVARQRKDANKGSRANHNRRDQRARKMARGGFPG
ncbi:hypothetical protein MMC28_001036 [Mycoblastus sanguinarius]|nr:hypothetical protein [Mycoblastus sanguinarius]